MFGLPAPRLRLAYNSVRVGVLSAVLLGACRAQPSPARLVWTASSALSLSPDGARLAAVNPDSDSVTFVDAHSLAVLAEVPVGDDPRTAAFTPDGNLVLVANRGSGSLSLVDVRRARVLAEIVVGGQPYAVVSAAGRAYASLSASTGTV